MLLVGGDIQRELFCAFGGGAYQAEVAPWQSQGLSQPVPVRFILAKDIDQAVEGHLILEVQKQRLLHLRRGPGHVGHYKAGNDLISLRLTFHCFSPKATHFYLGLLL